MLERFNCIEFNLIWEFFFDKNGKEVAERSINYNSLISLLKKLAVKTTERYSSSYLSGFWQGDDAERCIAEGIVTDSEKNSAVLKRIKIELNDIDFSTNGGNE